MGLLLEWVGLVQEILLLPHPFLDVTHKENYQIKLCNNGNPGNIWVIYGLQSNFLSNP